MKIRRFFDLLLGFLVGQGAMFIAQTLLVSKSEIALVGQVTIGLGLLTLSQWIADAGGVFLIPRSLDNQKNNLKFPSLFAARIVFVFILSLCVISFLALSESYTSYYGILVLIVPVLIVSSFSMLGFLDFFKRTKLSGILAGLPWFLSSLPLYYKFFVGGDINKIGFISGLLFLVGCIVSVGFQLYEFRIVYRKNELSYDKAGFFDKVLFIENFSDILKYNINYGFSQCYGRVVPILLSSLLGPILSGYYIYAKSFANIANQFVAFSRRVEFSNLVSEKKINIKSIFYRQKISFAISFLFFIFCFLFYIFDFLFISVMNSKVHLYIFIISIINLLWCISSSFSQLLIAKGKLGIVCLMQISTSGISLIIIYLGVTYFSIYSVFLAETIMYILQALLYVLIIKKIKSRL